ncbi:hypothetical protein CPB84DRAFT_1769135 [Gymnopilus junonius]|uniref:Uncharacterized protein n=1 Tax=Gymnopilus junonius TaxID=109634 RepID=A0A9P5NWS1_GYMJU|nr:hypothetical protein CPB84DRAFT_1769135 [Gymnopilus junonius]
MRFATMVALSTLASIASATAIPVVGELSLEGTGRGSYHHHDKSQHKKMASANIKGATVVGYKSDGNCYDKAMLSYFATLYPSSSGTCYYVPSKSGSSLDDLDERSLLEVRSIRKSILLSGLSLVHKLHLFKPCLSRIQPREFYDFEDFDARDYEDRDYFYGRDFDVLEGWGEDECNLIIAVRLNTNCSLPILASVYQLEGFTSYRAVVYLPS